MADIKSLPEELLLQIFQKIAGRSIEDISNVKVTCKDFLNFAEHNSVYKHASLEKFACLPMTSASGFRPFVHEVINDCHGEADEEYKGLFEWVMTPHEQYNKDRQLYFLKRCRESGNPEILYREGIVQYYQQGCCSLLNKMALENLSVAAHNGHDEAKYVYCMLLMIANDQHEQNMGFEIFCSLKKMSEFAQIKERVKSVIRSLWVPKHPVQNHDKSWCNSSKCIREKVSNEDDENNDIPCEYCAVNSEITEFCNI